MFKHTLGIWGPFDLDSGVVYRHRWKNCSQ